MRHQRDRRVSGGAHRSGKPTRRPSGGAHRAQPAPPARARRRRRHARRKPAPLVVLPIAALVLATLGANGTLSSWSSGIITNNQNTVGTAFAAILQESKSGVATPCKSNDDVSNSSTCTTINKYGGTATLLSPGSNNQTDVVFKNIGSAPGASFSVSPGPCSSTPSTGSPTPSNLCTSGELQISIQCSAGNTFNPGAVWTGLVYPASTPPPQAPPAAPLTYSVAANLETNDEWTCRITAALTSNATVLAQGLTVSQALTWTLNS